MALTKVSRNLLSTGIDDQSNATAITIDSSENVGIGVTPSSWSSSIYKGLQIGTGIGVGGIIGRVDGTNSINLGLNWYYGGGATNTYIDSAAATNYSQEAGTHRWFHAALGTAGGALTFSESMRIDSSGNVGIGTSSPVSRLTTSIGAGGAGSSNNQIAMTHSGASNSYHIKTIRASANDEPVGLAFVENATERMRIDSSGNVGIGVSPAFTAGGSRRLLQIANSTNGAQIAMSNSSSESENPRIFSDSINLGFATASTGGGVFQWYTSGTERMRIDSSGNLLHSTTDSNLADNTSGGGTVLQNGGGFQSAYTGNVGVLNRMGSDGSTLEFRNRAVVVGSVSTTSSSTTYNTSSDARLKEVTGSARGLEVINALNPVSYNWKADGKADEGLIAQEVLEIVPNAVSGSEEEYYQMDYSKLVTHLVAGMKEQQVLIEQLQAEVALLKGE